MQIRHDPEVCAEEYQCFLKHSGLSSEQLDVFNIYQQAQFGNDVIQGYNALLVGGASEANVLKPEKYPFVQPAIELLKHCVDISFPVFASCYGFQLAVLALGGEITNEPRCHETGTVPLTLTTAAATDPVFKGIPDQFIAVSVHQQSTEVLPDGCTLLAKTSRCIHAFRVTDKPIWGFQFHPEVDRQTLVERLTRYKKRYTANATALQEILDNASDTPESNSLLRRFIVWLENETMI